MNWTSFLFELPAPYQQILIWNFYRETIHGDEINRFYVCLSKDYLRVLGENNMLHINTFWAPFDPKKEREKIKEKYHEN